MPSTPSGIWYPDGTAPTNITTLMSTMASSIESVLSYSTKPPINFVANITARTALATSYAPTATKPLFVWRQDAAAGRNFEVTVNGTNWFPVPQAGQGGYAYAMQSGTTSLTVSSGQTSSGAVPIAFTAGRFTVAPNVTISLTNAPGSSGPFHVRTYGATVSGASAIAYVHGTAPTSAVSVTATWTAIQMTPTTANG